MNVDGRTLKMLKSLLYRRFTMPYNGVYKSYIIDKTMNLNIESLADDELEKLIIDLLKEFFNGKQKDTSYLDNCSNEELIYKMHECDINARDKLLEKNYPLIKYIANKYANYGLDIDDLIQEGSMSFLCGLTRFDPNRGNFATYIGYWIKKGILRFIQDNISTIRVPVYFREDIRKHNRLLDELTISSGVIHDSQLVSDRLGFSKEKHDLIMESKIKIYSLNTLILDGDKEYIDSLASDDLSPEEIISSDYSLEIINLIENSKLTNTEKIVIKMRFGFVDDKLYKLEEIAKVLGLTKQRIKQIEIKALKKLREDENAESLACYTNDEDASIRFLKRMQLFSSNSNKKK